MGRDVLIVGGGVIGLTAAHMLSHAGLRVTVMDQTVTGRTASWAGAGILPPGDFDSAPTPIDRLRALSTSQFRDYSARLLFETGIDNEYRTCGGVEFLTGTDEADLARWHAGRIAFERWQPGRLRERLSGVTPPADRVAYYVNDFAQVRNHRHLRALAVACTLAGCDIRCGEQAVGFDIPNGPVEGVRLKSGEVLRAGHYVIAAGAWAEPLLRQLGVTIPVRPVRGQIALLKPDAKLFEPILLIGKRYLLSRADGRVLVGATEEPESGFDSTTTPGAVAELVAFARALVPGLRDADVEASWAGLRPGSPDGRPTIGVAPRHANVIVAVGHFRAGIQQSIGTARLVRDLVLNEPPVIALDEFAADRVVGPPAISAFRS